ncbi:MAG: RNA 2'-phosphotransferase [Pseudomonadota bacterium]|nr:RNA 2'-phosphotransferase [Pseudomonadota bacterium]
MTDRDLSHRLSYVLRHRPDAAGISLDAAGWADVDALLAGLDAQGCGVDLAQLEHVVDTNDKQRFELDADATHIRARQGHSVAVALGYTPLVPPEILFHGTVAAALPAIREAGLQKMRRHAVHLSADEETAARVGARRGVACVLSVRAGALHRDGGIFFRTENGVWLTDAVPPAYVGIDDSGIPARGRAD